MLWIKRNLFLVVGIVISVALLGGAGWYVYSNSEEDFARDEELEKLKTEITTIESGPMFPSEANIALVKSNQLLPKPAHLTWEEAAAAGCEMDISGGSQPLVIDARPEHHRSHDHD